jgi:hypothetical protein
MVEYKDRKEYFKKYYKTYGKVYKARNKQKIAKYMKQYLLDRRADPEWQSKSLASQRARRRKLRLEVLNHYSKGTMKCAKCGVADERLLCIDHTKNNGADERRKLHDGKGSGGGTMVLCRYLKNHNYPRGYAVLCWNCNFLKHLNFQGRSTRKAKKIHT